MSKSKTPTKKNTKTTKKPASKPQKIYRLIEKTDLAKPIADCTSAGEALTQASAYANEHQVSVEISRGTLTGDTFKAEFTELVIPTTPEPTPGILVEPAEPDQVSTLTPEPTVEIPIESAQEPTTNPEATSEVPSEPHETTPPDPQPNTPSKNPKPDPKPRKMSALAAAAKILARTGEAMTTKTLIETMTSEGLWASPNGKTPEATLYAAILREIATKGKQSRFKKSSPGHFTFNVDSTRD